MFKQAVKGFKTCDVIELVAKGHKRLQKGFKTTASLNQFPPCDSWNWEWTNIHHGNWLPDSLKPIDRHISLASTLSPHRQGHCYLVSAPAEAHGRSKAVPCVGPGAQTDRVQMGEGHHRVPDKCSDQPMLCPFTIPNWDCLCIIFIIECVDFRGKRVYGHVWYSRSVPEDEFLMTS